MNKARRDRQRANRLPEWVPGDMTEHVSPGTGEPGDGTEYPADGVMRELTVRTGPPVPEFFAQPGLASAQSAVTPDNEKEG